MAADEDAQTGYAKLVGKRHVEAQNGAGGLVEEDFEALVTALPARLGRNGGGAAQGPNGEAEGCFVALGNIKSLSRQHATIEWDFEKGCYRVSCHSKNGMVVNKAHYARDEKAFLPHGSAVRIGPVNFYFHLPPQPGQEHAPVALPSSSDDEDDSIHAGGNGAAGGGSEGEDGDGGSRGVFGGGGGDGGDDMSRASSAVAGGGRSSLGGGGGGRASTGGKMTYSELVFKAFASPDLAEAGRTQGLTSSDVTGWITANYPEYATTDRKKALQNGVQNTLTRKFAKQDFGVLPAGQRGSRWKMITPGSAAAPSAASGAASTATTAAAATATTSSASALLQQQQQQQQEAPAMSSPAPQAEPAAPAAAPPAAAAVSMEVDEGQEQVSAVAAPADPQQPMAE